MPTQVKCPYCGLAHSCEGSKAESGSSVLPCQQIKGDIRVHVVDEESYRDIAKPIKISLSGDSLKKALERTTDVHGVATFDDLAAGNYTVRLHELSEDILKTHSFPAKDNRDVTVSNGEIAYVPFFLPRAPKWLRLQIFDMHQPRAVQNFTLEIFASGGDALGVPIKGTTDKLGILEQVVSPKAKSGTIVIGPDKLTINVTFSLSELQDNDEGYQKRLKHLGYGSGGLWSSEEIKEAISEFERDHGLTITGQCTKGTETKLKEVHDQKFTYTDSRT